MTHNRIEDAGEVIPAARKHLAEKTGPVGRKVQDGISLRTLWTEPDWELEVRNGRNAEVVAFLMCMYRGMAKKPPVGLFRKSDEELLNAYVSAVSTIMELAQSAATPQDIETFYDNFIERMGLKPFFHSGTTPHINDVYPTFVAGRITKTRFYPPTYTGEHQHHMGLWMAKMGWPDVPRLYEAGLFPLKLNDGTWRVAHATLNSYTWSALPEDELQSEEDAIRAIRAKVQAENKPRETGKSESKAIPKRPLIDGIVRSGPDWRIGEDITPERLLKEFGLKGLQFGNYITQSERRVWLNEIFDSLADLADILQFKRTWIGFGELGIAVGARGQGLASHAAHYEPELAVFNLTKDNGPGSICHEWGHAIDAKIKKVITPNKRYSPFASTCIDDAGQFDAKIWGQSPKSQYVARIMSSIMLTCKGNDTPEYYKAARKIDRVKRSGGYWASGLEMFARALEAFVQDELAERGQYSPWLVHGTLETDYDLGFFAGCPYPTGIEREVLNNHFKSLFATLITR